MLNSRTMLDIELELVEQHRKWGTQDHVDTFWLAILMEEMGELAQELVNTRDVYRDAGSKERDELIEKEIIQTISVAVNWLQRRRVNRGLL